MVGLWNGRSHSYSFSYDGPFQNGTIFCLVFKWRSVFWVRFLSRDCSPLFRSPLFFNPYYFKWSPVSFLEARSRSKQTLQPLISSIAISKQILYSNHLNTGSIWKPDFKKSGFHMVLFEIGHSDHKQTMKGKMFLQTDILCPGFQTTIWIPSHPD